MEIEKILFVIILFVLFVIAGTFVEMLLWDWLMPTLFNLPTITFWQMMGLNILSTMLFWRPQSK